MDHCLIYPDDLIDKLSAAHKDSSILSKWQSIGVNTVDDMVENIISELNAKYPKLSISNSRKEGKKAIKEKIESENESMFSGYFENENGNVDGLFFYIDPKLNSANEIIRAFMSTILGIRKKRKNSMIDHHINYMPVFIVNLNTTDRITQNFVKKEILCAEAIGFNYLDIFHNDYCVQLDKAIYQIDSLETLNNMLCEDPNAKKYFEIDKANQQIVLQDALKSSNPSQAIYGYSLFTITAAYLAQKNGYAIDASQIDYFTQSGIVTLRDYLTNI